MQVDVILVGTNTAPFTDFDGHRARHHVARGKVLRAGRITLHKAFAFRIGEIAAFAAHPFGDQHAGAINAGGMELHKLHILKRQAGTQHHGAAVTRLGVGAGAGEIGPAIAASGENDLAGAETMDGAIVQIPRHHADADAIVHDEVEREIFDEEVHIVFHALAIQRVQNGVAGAVGCGAGALCDAFPVMRGHAAEGALVDFAFRCARERHAEMLQLVNRFRRITAEIFDRVLIAQPVRPLDGVVHVPAPVILAHIAE